MAPSAPSHKTTSALSTKLKVKKCLFLQISYPKLIKIPKKMISDSWILCSTIGRNNIFWKGNIKM